MSVWVKHKCPGCGKRRILKICYWCNEERCSSECMIKHTKKAHSRLFAKEKRPR